MEEETIYEYEYLDENMKIYRQNVLKDFLISGMDKDLVFCDLEMYEKDKNTPLSSLKLIYKSKIDNKVCLTDYQIEILDIMQKNNIFLSAPTSFGKTFLVLEYLKRNEDSINNVIYIVPTIALMNELLKKIYNLFSDKFNICINGFEEIKEKNIFIFVPERSDQSFIDRIDDLDIDLLVFDELYKLKVDKKKDITNDDRIIFMNKVYLNLLEKSRKVFLLGPFIKHINFNKTKLDIVRYYTNFVPVYNKVIELEDDKWIDLIGNGKELIYFKKPENIYNNIQKILEKFQPKDDIKNKYKKEIDYLKEQIGDEWYVIELLSRGIGIHHGKTPMYLRKFYEQEYNNGDINMILCTNTLMEGINTPTNRLFVVDDPGDPFQLNNLIGRVGRLNPSDPIIGEIYLCNEKTRNTYKNVDKWLDLTVLAENEKTYTNDEILFLGKSPNEEKQNKDYNEKLGVIKEYGIDEETIKKYDVSFDKVYKFVKDDYKFEFENCDSVYSCVVKTIDLLGKIGYDFKTDSFYKLNTSRSCLSYKKYILDILNNIPIITLVKNFNDELNNNYDVRNINLFIDKIFKLRNYIKFKLSKILNYFELFEVKGSTDPLKKFISLVSSFGDCSGTDKILEDLGIEEDDFKIITDYLNIGDKVSTSIIIKKLKENKREILDKKISPFTKHNIDNL